MEVHPWGLWFETGVHSQEIPGTEVQSHFLSSGIGMGLDFCHLV